MTLTLQVNLSFLYVDTTCDSIAKDFAHNRSSFSSMASAASTTSTTSNQINLLLNETAGNVENDNNNRFLAINDNSAEIGEAPAPSSEIE